MQLLCLAPHVYQPSSEEDAQRFVPGEVYELDDPTAIRFLQDWGAGSVRLNGQEPRFEPYREPVDETEVEAEEEAGKPLEDFTIAELRVIAEEHGVDLTGITLKAEIIAAIKPDEENPPA